MSAREKRYGKAPPAVPGVKTGTDMARAAFAVGRGRRRAQVARDELAPPVPTFDDFDRAERRRGRG